MGSRITVSACKYDGSVHREWQCDLLDEDAELFTLYGTFEHPVDHPELGLIEKGTGSFEYYWKDRWFNVFKFMHPDGRLRGYYCNINLPPSMTNGILKYVDLEIDILVDEKLSYRIVDIEEFKENALKYRYSSSVVDEVEHAVKELLTLIESRQFPFDHGV